MDAVAEIGRNPVKKHQIQHEYGDEQAGRGTGLLNPSRETKFSGANGDREIFIFPVQLTTSRIGNLLLSRLIFLLLYVIWIAVEKARAGLRHAVVCLIRTWREGPKRE